MTELHAFDPKAVPARRAITVDGARHYAHVLPVLWTSQRRCSWRVNSKRPAWRCKQPPTHSVQMPWLRDVHSKGVPSVMVCEAHVADVLARSYVVEGLR